MMPDLPPVEVTINRVFPTLQICRGLEPTRLAFNTVTPNPSEPVPERGSGRR